MKSISYMRISAFSVFFLLILLGISSMAVAKQPEACDVRLTAGDPVEGAEFGRSVAIDGNLVAVGAGNANAGSTSGAGAVYLFHRQGQTYIREAKLVAPDATSGAEFGRAVAIQGNLVAVGSRFAEAGGLEKAGAVYLFRKHMGSWRYEAKVSSPNPADEDNFGRAVALQGNILVVTSRKEESGADDVEADDVGAAYVFLHRGNRWIFSEKLTAGDPVPKAYFGQSVALRGNLLAIGARNADPEGAGAVYLFQRTGEGWKEFAKVIPPDGAKDDNFGFTVAMLGNTMAVGARRADPGGTEDAGAAYVFSVSGHTVDHVATLTASDGQKKDQFGQSIAMAGDVIAVGANRADIGKNAGKKGDQGAIYLFRRADNSWKQIRKLTACNGLAGDEFGYSLSAFGNKLVTGAHFADSTAGAAYVLPLKP